MQTSGLQQANLRITDTQEGAVQTTDLQADPAQTRVLCEGSAQTAGQPVLLHFAPTAARSRPWDTSEELLDTVMHQLRHQFQAASLPG